MFEITEVLQRVPFFQVLDQEGINFVVERLKYKRYEAEEVICGAGDPGDKMYIIIDGQVKVVVFSEDREENIIAYLKSGDYFGEMALLTGESRSASVVTTDASEMLVLEKTDFDRVIENYPSITLSLGKIISQRLRNTLRQTAEKGGRITAVEGDLSDKSMAEILRFCERNRLNGTLTLTQNGRTGHFFYEGGALQNVSLEELSEDESLDIMLNWQEGRFSIEPRVIRADELADTEKTIDLTPITEKPSQNGKARVLIVNNSMVVQRMIQRTLEQHQYDVNTVATAESALKAFDSFAPALIISGTKLPDQHGIDMLKTLRKTSELPLIFLTEKRNKALIQSQTKNESNVYYTNSQALDEIVRAVEDALQARA